MSDKKILITGATGMLGSRVLEVLSDNPSYKVFNIGRSGNGEHHIPCDISDTQRFSKILTDLSPDYIIHSAANVNLENCDKEKEYTYRLHVAASRTIASNKNVTKSIFISTDSVFDGQSGNYSEDDFVAPLNYYALTKALAEESFFNAAHKSIVLRTNIFGFNRPFRTSLFEWAWNNLKNNVEISGYKNVYFNPLYVGTLARTIGQLLSNEACGPLHVGCVEGISKYDFILEIARLCNFPSSLIKESYAENNGPIKRPMNTTLNVQKIQLLHGIPMPDIYSELSELFKDLNTNKSSYAKGI